MTRTDKQEWQHIAVYQSGKEDILRTIIEHFGGKVSKEVLVFLNIEQELASEHKAEAEANL